MDDIEAMETNAMKACEELEKCVKRYSETWTSLHNELKAKVQKDEHRNMAVKQETLALEARIMEAETSSSDCKRVIEENVRRFEELKIEDTTAVDVLTDLNFDKAASKAEARRKEEMLLSKILNMGLQYWPFPGILSAVYEDGENLIPFHVLTNGKDPCDVADDLWNFAAECSTKK
ncbi:hypothetical protein MTO96_030261 [Rhipicephalus appendiculatus]